MFLVRVTLLKYKYTDNDYSVKAMYEHLKYINSPLRTSACCEGAVVGAEVGGAVSVREEALHMSPENIMRSCGSYTNCDMYSIVKRT